MHSHFSRFRHAASFVDEMQWEDTLHKSHSHRADCERIALYPQNVSKGREILECFERITETREKREFVVSSRLSYLKLMQILWCRVKVN
jgi:hypothetical protein